MATQMQLEVILAGNRITTRIFEGDSTQFFGGVPSYFEALWYPHLYVYRKSNT